MSTFYREFKRFLKPVPVTVSILLLFIAYHAWNGSTISGGSFNNDAYYIAYETAKFNYISPMCFAKAAKLADASIRARVAKFRPTSRLQLKKEKLAINDWHLSRCPDRALVSIAYGVAKTTLNDEKRRSIYGRY